jgi:TonB family protein
VGPPAPGRPGLRLPPGLLGRTPSGDEGRRPEPGISGETVDRAVQEAARRAADSGGAFGMPNGTASDISGLHFDAQGADFTVWLSHLRNEFWRNFVVPQTAYLGFRGRVVIRFTVERNGDTSAIDAVQSTGTSSLDRSVANAISGSRYLPLPDDYRPARVTFHLIFDYR